MKLEDKAVELVKEYSLCDYCLGRQFSDLATGTTNLDRGRIIKNFITMRSSDVTDESNISILQFLSRSGSIFAKNTLKKNKIESEITTICYICENSLEKIDFLADLIISKSEDFDFQTFLIGTIIPENMKERENIIKEQFDVKQTEFLKQEFNRNIGKNISEKKPKMTDFQSPDVIFEINPFTLELEVRITSLYVYGRYNKFLRTLPQTRWPCRRCKGKGCIECNNTGKKHQESVEELIEVEAIKLAKADKGTLHGGGREDIDALMLGTGRPFVFELVNPKIRSLNLEELEEKINNYASGKVKVNGFRWSSKKELIHIKSSSEKAIKQYRALVKFNENISNNTIQLIEKEFNNKVLQQRTPIRVSHRRADKIRKKKVYSVKCTKKTDNEIEMIVECDGGCYVKELISGDSGRTKPSISEVTGNEAVCIELDVIHIKDIPFIPKE